MALRDVKSYYKKIESQYFGLLAKIKEFDEALKLGEVSPEQMENAKQMVAKIEDNYKRWAYLMFLLNLPAKKKQKKYISQHNKLYENTKPYSAEESLEESEYVLKKFEKLLEEVKDHDKLNNR